MRVLARLTSMRIPRPWKCLGYAGSEGTYTPEIVWVAVRHRFGGCDRTEKGTRTGLDGDDHPFLQPVMRGVSDRTRTGETAPRGHHVRTVRSYGKCPTRADLGAASAFE